MRSERQCTLARTCEFEPGVGLHSGLTVRMRCRPAPEGYGIRFCRADLPGAPEIPAVLDQVIAEELTRRTALAVRPGVEVNTVEHVLAACCGLGLDNLRVEVDGAEIPFFDGSAALVAEALLNAGIQEQEAPRQFFSIERPFVFREDMVEIVALPSEEFRLTFFVDYAHPAIGAQSASLAIAREAFRREIAPARTFCLEQEVEPLRAAGLIRGGSADCAIVFGHAGPLNTDLLCPNEPARHKLLDLLGDVYLLGRRLRGHILASRSGHRSNIAFLRQLRKEFDR